MVTADLQHPLILRAELGFDGQHVVTHTLSISPTEVTIASDQHLPIGTELDLRLSFLRYLEPIELRAAVDSHIAAAGHGAPESTVLRFVFRDEAEHARLASLSQRAQAPRTVDLRVLLVEDSCMIRDMFAYGTARYSTGKGRVEIETAGDGETAWRMLTGGSYDLAIIDHYLPAMDGATLIRKVREEPRLADLPIISISVGGRAAFGAMVGAGADLFLNKPLELRGLFRTIEVLAPAHDAGGPPDAHGRILIVDDSPLLLEMTRAALVDRGYEVLTATDLAELERHTESGELSLILLDVQMPEAFGDDVGMVLRAVRGIRTPIYLFSSLDESELGRRAENAQLDGYISKQRGVDALVQRVGEIIHAERNA
jgi:CheY-like chemotaxis protein